jgi:hypothetical protein
MKRRKHIIQKGIEPGSGWWVNQGITDLDSTYLENRAAFWGPHAREFAREHAKRLNCHPDFKDK